MKTEKAKNYIIRYVLYTYGLFGLLLLTLGGIVSLIWIHVVNPAHHLFLSGLPVEMLCMLLFYLSLKRG